GAERISADAKDALVAYMEKAGLDAAEKAIKMAAVAKRKTIKAEDIELATE
ncbi:MAG: NFYB/HAP3 family transcription factor subunit, partial [archaeon]|nr:NFYB/HAP3 family transcription factor subunit [archaeon]